MYIILELIPIVDSYTLVDNAVNNFYLVSLCYFQIWNLNN